MLVKPSGSIYVKSFNESTDDIRKISDSSVVDASSYTVTAPVSTTFSIVEIRPNRAVISIATASDPGYYKGQSIEYYDSVGLLRHNKVIAIGVKSSNTVYELNEGLSGYTTSDNVAIRPVETKIEFSDLDEGAYILEPDNRMLICRSSWGDMFIPYGELVTIHPDLKNVAESDIEGLNDRARDQIYSDIATSDIEADIIVDENYRTLKIKAIICIFSYRFDVSLTSEQRDYCEEYSKALSSYVTHYKRVNNGKENNFEIDADADVETYKVARWSL